LLQKRGEEVRFLAEVLKVLKGLMGKDKARSKVCSFRKNFPYLDLLILLSLGFLLSSWAAQPSRGLTWPLDTPSTVLPLTNFQAVERFPATYRQGTYRWTKGLSQIALPNPGGNLCIRLLLASGRAQATSLTLTTSGLNLALEVSPELRNYTFLLPAQPGERFTLTLSSPTEVIERRNLGIVVGAGSVWGGGEVPRSILLLGALATISLYLLLHQVQTSKSFLTHCQILFGIFLFQVLFLLWQTLGGWCYALGGPLLLGISSASLAALGLERWILPCFPRCKEAQRSKVKLPHLALLILVGGALVVRLPWLLAPDPVGDLELAARRMGYLQSFGLTGAYLGDGDYMPLRLYLLWFLSQGVVAGGGRFTDPLSPLTIFLIKVPSLLADLTTIALLFGHGINYLPSQRAFMLAALYACAPLVWINVAWWGQVDALLILPLVAMVLLLDRAEGKWSWAFWAIALLLKPQAIIFAPLLYLATLRQHGCRGLVKGSPLALLIFVLGILPLSLAGQAAGLLQAYFGSVGRFPMLTAGAYNFWYLFTQGRGGHDTSLLGMGLTLRHGGLLLMGLATGLISFGLLRRADSSSRIEGAALLALAFFLLPTQIHERYLFLATIFLALNIVHEERLVLPFTFFVFSGTINIFGELFAFLPSLHSFLQTLPLLPQTLAASNLLLFGMLLGHFLWQATLRPFQACSLERSQR